MHSATLATLSAVPRSMRFHLRYAGIVGRWIAPGPNTSGSSAAISARMIERIPPTPTRPCGSSERSSNISASSALADIRHGNERQPVAGRADHELERAMLDERVDQQRGIGAHVGGAEAALEHDLAPVEPADVERERARVDARDARTQTSPFATS